MKADIWHSEAELKLLEKYAANEEEQQNALDAVDGALDAYWGMLTGIQSLCMHG